MTEHEWNSAPISDLLLFTLEIHRARYGVESEQSYILSAPTSTFRVDMGRKHMLLAFGVLRRYWLNLDSAVKQAVEALEGLEDKPSTRPDPPLDDFNHVMDLFLAPMYRGSTDDEMCMAKWLVGGWWPEVKTVWAERNLPENWRPIFDDIFGDFFRPVSFEPAWRTVEIQSLAQAIYDQRQFDRVAILADTLEASRCDNVDILNHCRQPREHCRGCWCLDLILEKK